MRKLTLIVHTSLDGFVADTNGGLGGFDASEKNLQFVCSLTRDADTALLGRISYELLNSYWPVAKDRPNATRGEIDYSNWYNHAQKIVVSRKLQGGNAGNTTVINDNISSELSKLKNQQGKSILLFGSPSLSQLLMKEGLIDDYWIFVNPSIFGSGVPLFKAMPEAIKLKLLSTSQFPNGEFAMNYRVEG